MERNKVAEHILDLVARLPSDWQDALATGIAIGQMESRIEEKESD